MGKKLDGPKGILLGALWRSNGVEILGRLAKAFGHPTLGYTDAYVMYREIE